MLRSVLSRFVYLLASPGSRCDFSQSDIIRGEWLQPFYPMAPASMSKRWASFGRKGGSGTLEDLPRGFHGEIGELMGAERLFARQHTEVSCPAAKLPISLKEVSWRKFR